MKMKLRVLTDTNKGKLLSIASTLASNSDYKADVIPPAYSCDKERIVVLAISAKGNISLKKVGAEDAAKVDEWFQRVLTKLA